MTESIRQHLEQRALQGDVNCQAILDSWGKTGDRDKSNVVSAYIKEHGLPNLPPIDPEAEAEVIAEQKERERKAVEKRVKFANKTAAQMIAELNTEHDAIDDVPGFVRDMPSRKFGPHDPRKPFTDKMPHDEAMRILTEAKERYL